MSWVFEPRIAATIGLSCAGGVGGRSLSNLGVPSSLADFGVNALAMSAIGEGLRGERRGSSGVCDRGVLVTEVMTCRFVAAFLEGGVNFLGDRVVWLGPGAAGGDPKVLADRVVILLEADGLTGAPKAIGRSKLFDDNTGLERLKVVVGRGIGSVSGA